MHYILILTILRLHRKKEISNHTYFMSLIKAKNNQIIVDLKFPVENHIRLPPLGINAWTFLLAYTHQYQAHTNSNLLCLGFYWTLSNFILPISTSNFHFKSIR